jgi:hypothetical protein
MIITSVLGKSYTFLHYKVEVLTWHRLRTSSIFHIFCEPKTQIKYTLIIYYFRCSNSLKHKCNFLADKDRL